MKHRPLKQLCGLLASAAIALVLIGCNGKAGQDGSNGTNGTNGTNGNNGTNGVITVNAAALTPEEWAAQSFTGTVTSATVTAAAGKPVVNFKVTDKFGVPVSGLGFTTKSATALVPSYANIALSIAKLVPGTNGSPSIWVNYIVTSTPTTTTAAAPSKPSTDSVGTLVDNGDGSYKYTFYRDITATQAFLDAYTPYSGNNTRADLGNVTFDGTLVHRVSIQIGGSARGTGSNTPDASNSSIVSVPVKNPANIIYDFVPATGVAAAITATRDIVDLAACNQCHTELVVHGGSRVDPRYCVVCHTDQRKYGNAEATTTATGYSGSTSKINGLAVGEFTAFIHRMHMGESLTKTGYNYANILFNEVTYPQDQRNCVKCHDGARTSQGDNWKNVPSRKACGACHDQVNFVTGLNHGTLANGGPQLDDKNCVGCHSAAGIDSVHTPVVAPNAANALLVSSGAAGAVAAGYNNNTNAANVAAYTNSLPAGAHTPTWDLKSLTLDATGHPVFTFRFLEDGVRKDFLTYAAGTVPSFWANYVGGPSFYVAFGLPQDGIAQPADWNNTVSIYFPNAWRKDNKTPGGVALAATAATTLSATPDASGYYTLTLTGVAIPTTATMITGGIGYTYGLSSTQPLTQTDVPGYPYTPIVWTAGGSWTGPSGQGGMSVPAPNIAKPIASLPAGFPTNPGSTTAGPATATRRAIVTNAKCNDCHAALGVFTEKGYHAAQRNDAPTCNFCHNVNKINSGWGVNIKEAVHAIHASAKRLNKFSWEAISGDSYWNVTYPAVLNNCEACHVTGSFDFTNSASVAALPNLLWTGVAAGAMTTATSFSIVTGSEVVTSASSVISPWINPSIHPNPGVVLPLGTAYGANYAYNSGTQVITQAKAGSLVNSPITGACTACHDAPDAIAHIRGNGGSFYAPRPADGTLPAAVEQCLICHGDGKVADIRVAHLSFK